jgi:hypothetical protein
MVAGTATFDADWWRLSPTLPLRIIAARMTTETGSQ